MLKVRLDNPKGAYVPGMTAEVLVSPEQLKGTAQTNASAEQPSMISDLNPANESTGAPTEADTILRPP